MEIRFNFGGFYGSHYNDSIDSALEDESQEFVDCIDFKKVHNEVAKAITTKFEEFLSNEYDLDIDLKFVELQSPRIYNFSTDVIIVNISKEDRIKMDLLVKDDEDVSEKLISIVDDSTTSKIGYVPFYNFKDVMNRIDEDNSEVYYQCLLDALRLLDEDTYYDTTLDALSESVINSI